MFLELHIYLTKEKVLVNIVTINAVYKDGDTTKIFFGDMSVNVIESYDEIVDAINNFYKLYKA